MYPVFLLAIYAVGLIATVLALAIRMADNQKTGWNLAVLSCSALIAGVYDWFFVPPIFSLAVESGVDFANVVAVFAVTATCGVLISKWVRRRWCGFDRRRRKGRA
jgi:hypothetical protein